ncbi:von Willebrand factor type A domain-containing protein [Amycolatopsis xylanica]|uniref:von Willebrand factor type A domain-containing protein n=1 Tax=Amycolatopsis xylanica TaxID=589385 RepID=A0A1H2RYP0_9PSEU|nr:VWA domain-containing protein [Amycolatopsis xylanica]SDW24407.1 von Willebrand factor type A domain-containing protein [Amycolatopsis xylanica]
MPLDFQIQVDQNEYLPADGRLMDAVISVTASGEGLTVPAADLTVAQVIMIDCSGSMEGAKLVEAKRAVKVAVNELRNGVKFAIVAGSNNARLVYPVDGKLAVASGQTRQVAAKAVGRLRVEGGTAIGSWLEAASRLLSGSDAKIKHGLLLTDGQNVLESDREFAQTLRACEGEFVCDSRGVGTGWSADTLDQVATALLGSAKGLLDPSELAADFREINETLMGRATADVGLRLWTPAHARVRFLKQVFPRISDLTGRGVEISPRIQEYPTGHWGAETRDYHLSVEVEPGAVGEGMVAARVRLVAGAQESEEHRVRAKWTEDLRLSTRISPQVAHFTGQADIAELVEDGLTAKAAGDNTRATAKLQKAREIAVETGNTHVVKRLDDINGGKNIKADMAHALGEMLKLDTKRTHRKEATGDADLP